MLPIVIYYLTKLGESSSPPTNQTLILIFVPTEMLPTRVRPDNSTLSISSPHIRHCLDVAEYLRKCEIPCHVTSNYTVVQNNRHSKDSASNAATKEPYSIETGCQIKFGSHHPHLINSLFWSNLRQHFQLECAHLEVEGKFKGCIYDYFTRSTCPHQRT